MKKYIAYNIVNKIKFYLKQNGEFENSYDNLRVFLEDEIGRYFDNKKRTYVLKTNFSQLYVEELSN